jgi:hypothetical protein
MSTIHLILPNQSRNERRVTINRAREDLSYKDSLRLKTRQLAIVNRRVLAID